MHTKWEAIKGSAGFFITLAVCLLVVGISGYFLLFDRDTEDPAVPAADTAAITPIPETVPAGTSPEEVKTPSETTITVLSEEPLAVETPQPMPEAEIDDTPVMAEAPRIVVSPLSGEVAAVFSVSELVYNPTLEDWRIHDGIDISASEGSSVLAACSGTVLSVEDDALMGTTVVLEHAGGYQTTYASLQTGVNVAVGDAVSAGQIIGAVGTTAAAEAAQGPHLHFSVTRDGDAVDPGKFLEE